MERNFEYRFIEKISIRPNKIVRYQEVIKFFNTPEANAAYMDKKNNVAKIDDNRDKVLQGSAALPDPVKLPESNKHNFQLSHKAATRIREKVTWLYELARNKTVTTSSGKILQSFKMNFITLTLPAQQKHSTAEVTSLCLNQFITEMNRSVNMENYVWRLEYQQNGNVHYHIATDVYIDFDYCRAVWNRCISKLGYIEDYHNIFSKLSFQDYNARVNADNQTPINVVSERYAIGCRNKWRMPNTVDVRAVANAKNIAFYISKYITKNEPMKITAATTARDAKCSNMRLWFCSRSLSKLDKITYYIEAIDDFAEKAVQSITNFKVKFFDYCRCIYFSSREQSNDCKRLLWRLFQDYAATLGYSPAV